MNAIDVQLVQDSVQMQALVRIYQSSLEPSEQKPAKDILAMLENDKYRLFIAVDNTEIIGFAIVYINTDLPMALLEYMAISAEIRSRGFGSTLFSQCLQAVRKEIPDIPLLLEVDSPYEGSHDLPNRERRFRFYRRLGCRVLSGLHYVLPPLNDLDPPEMVLMIECSASIESISTVTAQAWLADIYRRVYARRADDPAIHLMLEPFDTRIEII